MKAIATQVHETFVAAGWTADIAVRAALRVRTPEAAAKIVTVARKVPDSVRAIILRDKNHSGDAAIVAAFSDAAEFASILDQCARSAPLRLRNLESYTFSDSDGRHLMTSKDACEKLTNALAEMDQHIDTARRIPAADRSAITSMQELSDVAWVLRKGETK